MKALWALQSRCDYGCLYCYFKVQDRSPCSATLPAVRRIAGTLSQLGAKQVLMSGGEPLDFRYWREATAECASRAMDVVLTTNGVRLTARNVERLLDSGAKAAIVSLDSHRAEHHNRVRPGADHATVVARIGDAVRIGDKSGFRVGVCTVLTSANLEDLPDTVRFAIDLGVHYLKFQVIHVPAANRGLSDLALGQRGYDRLLDMLDLIYSIGRPIVMPVREKMQFTLEMLRKSRTTVAPCWAGQRLIFVSETGRLHPCPVLSMAEPGRAPAGSRLPNVAALCVDRCEQFSSDCACLWEVAFQTKFP